MGILADRPTITFLCPTFVTGGSEAIHQAAAAFRLAGANARIAYYGKGISLDRVGDTINVTGSDDNVCLQAFAAYEPVHTRQIVLDPSSLVVMPEVLAGSLDTVRPARIALWWLSVDNALLATPALREEAPRLALFERRDVEHWYQSDYARRFLLANGARTARRLTDFTPDAFTSGNVDASNGGCRILYNRRKGAALAERFFSANRDLEPQALDGLDRDALIAAYRSAPIYVDFGPLPGKDRMPREAAACGCTIFLHDVGAGREMGDFPVHDIFRFKDEDIDGGQLAAKLRMTLASTGAWELQAILRAGIRQERDAFELEAARLAATWGQAHVAAPVRRLAIA